ncbi:dienelactone hydrolase family protein [Ferrovibrio xuzhouensis]|uniref:Dienelactone hydrolase family protein n=1 Tax=Ferrovibrio xuzhouensis TaxID=1576914 RepID=A0ABV7VDP8_9PROT
MRVGVLTSARAGASVICLLAGMVIFAPAVGTAQEMVHFEASAPDSPTQVELRAELYRPDGNGQFPAVVLMHGCGGWQPAVRYGLQTHARYLQQHGFVVLNVDSFGPRDRAGGKMCASDPALYKALDYRTSDAFDSLRYLQKQNFVSPANVFLMGQSNGGAVAVRVAKAVAAKAYQDSSLPTFRGVVAYYPWCGEVGSRISLSSPLLIFAGGKDDWVPARECQGARASGAALQVRVYPEAAHSFDLDIIKQRYLGKLIGADEPATQDSRERMLAFFVGNLTPDSRNGPRGVPADRIIVAQNATAVVAGDFLP